VKARTEDDSHVDFDLSSTSGASTTNFIRFESVDRPMEVDPLKAFYARRRQREKTRGRLTVDLGLEVNPRLAVGLDIRNSTINGMLSATGDGNMRLLIDPRGTQLFGTYRILNGMFDFSMMDLINKRFKIKEGGSIVWTGPLTDARVDVEAVYTTRTSLYPVLAAVGTTMLDEGNLRKKVSVESIIELDGNLLNPDIRFNINLLNVEEDLRDLFFSYVNKEDEDEMIRQTFSLLMLNSFMATDNAGQGGAMSGSNALVSSSELLFNQFNNFLSRLTTNFNVGMNYTPASEMNESEFQVMLSGQLFDDRLSIDGNIGVSEMEAKAASSVVGDINIEWKFTEQLRLKAFNRSNEKSLNQPDNSYTQGLGVIFRRDFNTGKELFSRIGP
ncbi:MAG: translocation/assembly module TamB, partial [Bacteroidales bacterium]|nr:translocation/assembly module TamB [Bacteroidales bacterium]